MKKILVSSGLRYKRAALMEDSKLVDFYVDDANASNITDNIYMGVVKDVVKKMDAVFIDIGREKNAYMQLDNAKELPKMGEKVLVQVLKDESDMKGAAVSQNITIVGRYIVIIINKTGKNMPKNKIMISNDLSNSETKEFKEKLKSLNISDEYNLIIRKEAVNVDFDLVKLDLESLIKIYEDIKIKFASTTKIATLYKKGIDDIVINELYDKGVEEIVTDSKDFYNSFKAKMKLYDIDEDKLRLYDDSMPLFELHKIDSELKKALSKFVWLKNGAQILIEHTEALTVIDVNTSKFEGKKELEETSYKTNVEAAKEIARQIRLRNISGIIIVDFINMKSPENINAIVNLMKECTKKDKIKVNVLEMTKLGLLEMTRQKKRKMLKDILKSQK